MWRDDDPPKWADGWQNGPIDLITQKIAERAYLIMEDIFVFGFAKILHEQKKLCYFENRRRFF